jgi:hypothetical protein
MTKEQLIEELKDFGHKECCDITGIISDVEKLSLDPEQVSKDLAEGKWNFTSMFEVVAHPTWDGKIELHLNRGTVNLGPTRQGQPFGIDRREHKPDLSTKGSEQL